MEPLLIPSLRSFLALLPEKHFLQPILAYSIHENLLLEQYYEILPFDLSGSFDEYIQSLEQTIWDSPEQGMKILTVILDWWFSETKIQMNGFEGILKEYGEPFAWFWSIVNGHLVHFYQWKYHSNVTLIKTNEWEEMILLKSQSQQWKEQLAKQNSSTDKTMLKACKNQLQQMSVQLKAKEEALLLANNEHQNSKQEIRRLTSLLTLCGKSVVVIGVEWPNETIRITSEKYKLARLSCLSAIEKSYQMENISADYIVFSTKQAKHDMYYKLKQENYTFFHTDKTNADLVFEELIQLIGRELE